jgi:hypothetical protein
MTRRHTSWRFHAIGALFTFAASAAWSQAACSNIVRIGAWNIKYFGKSPQQAPADVASYIKASRVDVLALEEISMTGKVGGKPRNAKLDKVAAELSKGAAKWEYALFDKRPKARDPLHQWTGLMWNSSRAIPVGAPWKVPLKVDAAREKQLRNDVKTDESVVIWSRWPQAMKFSAGPGKADFVVVPLHLKSNNGDKTGGPAAPGGLDKSTAGARGYEMELLLGMVGAMKKSLGDGDIIFLGDTNMRRHDERAGKLLAEAGFRDCNQHDAKTYVGGSGSPFDRIFVLSDQPETKNTCSAPGGGSPTPGMEFGVLKSDDWRPGLSNPDFEEMMSDHVLVYAGVCADQDDD